MATRPDQEKIEEPNKDDFFPLFFLFNTFYRQEDQARPFSRKAELVWGTEGHPREEPVALETGPAFLMGGAPQMSRLTSSSRECSIYSSNFSIKGKPPPSSPPLNKTPCLIIHHGFHYQSCSSPSDQYLSSLEEIYFPILEDVGLRISLLCTLNVSCLLVQSLLNEAKLKHMSEHVYLNVHSKHPLIAPIRSNSISDKQIKETRDKISIE